MKKIIALSLALMTLACILSACGNKPPKGTEIYTKYGGGDEMAVVTDEDGDIYDDQGQIWEVQTDKDGKPIKDADGENQTVLVDLDTAFIHGRTIEFSDYKLVIPEGWENNASYSDLTVKKTGSSDQIKIMQLEKADLNEKTQENLTHIQQVKSIYPDAVVTNTSVDINDENCSFVCAYIPKANTGEPFFFGFIILEKPSGVFNFMITGKRDILADNEEILKIISSVQYK